MIGEAPATAGFLPFLARATAMASSPVARVSAKAAAPADDPRRGQDRESGPRSEVPRTRSSTTPGTGSTGTGSSPKWSAATRKRKRGDPMRRRTAIPLLLLLPALLGQAPAAKDDGADQAAKARRERLHRIYLGEAEGYAIFRDPSRAEKLTLRREPVYVWTNPVRGGEQDGEVFVWTCRGRAECVGTFFSFPSTGPRNLHHELHALSTTTLDVSRAGANGWSPGAPGLQPAAIADAPAPGRSAPLRMSQMRALTRDFAATTEDDKGRRWDLRILPQPLYRYESTDPEVLDGAVFAFVTSAGTDPEAILVLEARKAPGAPAPTWHYGLGRFTDMKLTVKHKGKAVMEAPLIPWDSPPNSTAPYRTFRDRGIPALEPSAGADASGAAGATTGPRLQP